MTAPLSAQEQQYYDRLFETVNKDDSGVLPGSEALPFLTSSGLPQQTLGEIWAIADPDNNGFLTREGFYRIDPSLATKAGPMPTFKGYPGPAAAPSANPMSPATTGGSLPPLTPADRTKFTRIFVGCGPANGLVTGEKARNVFLKSKLPYDKLAQIWQLADTQDRGALDLTDFIVGMHLIQSCMANPSLHLPASLPPGLYEVASNGRPQPNASQGARPTSPIQVQTTGPLQRQTTGTLQPQMTGQSFSAATNTPPRSATMTPSRQASTAAPFNPYGVGGGHNRASSGAAEPWDVTPDAKATSDRFFAQLDPQNKGVVEGDVAVPFMLQSQLDEATLASIWDLADIRQEGKLDRDEFAVAMHLINAKLAGQDIPTVLPSSLIPPSLRGSHSGERPEVTQPSAASKDLFDLFNDSNEATPATPSGGVSVPTAFLPQPPSRRGTGAVSSRQLPSSRATQSPEPFSSAFAPAPQPAGDLLGDDSATSVPEKSADIGNKKLQLENTSRGLSQLEKTKADLNHQESANAADLQTLERELASARSKHEAETKAVSDLRIRVGEQTAKLKQLRADVISAESDLNAMRMEKDELEQSFLRDKEEVRGLQKQIKELEDEKTGLKLLLDKVRKEARQQKGLVSIAKKQVSTAESGRDAVQADIREAEKDRDQGAVAATVPSPSPLHTPRALSPNATGASQRSTNPFERFRTPSAELSPAIASVGAAGAAGAAGLFAGTAVGGAMGAGGSTASLDAPPSHSGAEGAEPAVGQSQEQDPFGMPMAASSAAPAAGFDDSFSQQVPAIRTEQSPTDFDSAFADFDTEVTPAAPSADDMTPIVESQSAPNGNESIQSPELDRSLSTQAIPPSSQRSTPLPTEEPTEDQLPPAGMPESSTMERTEQLPTKELAPGDAESSDDEEGPEDIDGPRRAYGTENGSGSQEAMPRSDSLNLDPEHPAARVRRHAPPPPTGRQSSRSDSITSPATDERSATASAAPASPAAIDPFGAPVDVSSSAVNTQLQPEVTAADFGESFDPLTANGATGPMQATDASAIPGAFPGSAPTWPSTVDNHSAPKASEFDDDEFDFSDVAPIAKAEDQLAPVPAPVTTDFATPQPLGQQDAQLQQASQQQQSSQQSQLPQGLSHPQQVEQQQQQQPNVNAFDDEFANFDDDFGDFPSQGNSGSDNNSSMLRSYEVVGSSNMKPGQQASESAEGGADAWGLSNNNPVAASQPAALSFDDAFGGDFSPAPSPAPVASVATVPSTTEQIPTPTPPIPARPNPPSARPSNDVPQADDLEDVKRLCSMGFPRSLVVEALDANGYDFQKALNVLLVK